jgi:hypothetical protein
VVWLWCGCVRREEPLLPCARPESHVWHPLKKRVTTMPVG